MSIELTILKNLIFNDEYSRRVLPYINTEYFQEVPHKVIFKQIRDHVTEYNSLPTKEILSIGIDNLKNLSQKDYSEVFELISKLDEPDKDNFSWLVDQTESFCRDKAIYNAIMESITIIDDESGEKTANAIPEILSDALSVSFDTHIGHDYIDDSDERYEFYHKIEKKIPFDLEFMNKITGGGTPSKTLNIVMAGTGVGKSLFMCHHAAACLLQNLNVLYITCEMAEERIAERIDANIMDISLDNLKELPYENYRRTLNNSTTAVSGKLIIKEYPTATANANHFRILMDELNLKKKFKPDIVFIDYLNICASSRLKQGSNINTYQYVKAIAEELRGLAVEKNIPIFSATQTNRTGFSSTDVSLEDTSESFGLPATADFMFALISTEEMDEHNQIMVKQLKNRYNDTAINRKFILEINRSKMKLSDVPREDQQLIESNQTESEGFGRGFDGKQFDDKFEVAKEKISDWQI